MDITETRRSLYRHGAILMTIAFALGVVAGGMGDDPRARLWLGAHTTGIMVGLLVIAVGAMWPELRLERLGRRVAYLSAVGGNWLGLAVLGVFAPAAAFGSPITSPTLPPPPAWAQGVVGVGLLIVTISTFTMCGAVIYGLRGRTEAAAPTA